MQTAHFKDYRYRRPKNLPARPAKTGTPCPFCDEHGYLAPGPCSVCNCSGWPQEQPPNYRLDGWTPEIDPEEDQYAF